MSKKEKSEVKVGACLKCWVLWSKRDKGLALTMDKNLASKKADTEDAQSL